MKKVAFGMACGLVSLFVVLLMLTLFGRAARKSETEYMLAQAMDSSLSGAMQKQGETTGAGEEFTADFLKALLIQANSDSELTVSVLDADEQKGILSVEITERFRHPNGNEGSVSQARTVIFDRAAEQEPEYCRVGFYLEDGEMYKEYRVPKGSVCSIPVSPRKEGKRFLYWRFATGAQKRAGSRKAAYSGGTKEVLSVGEEAYPVSEDTRLVAVFE